MIPDLAAAYPPFELRVHGARITLQHPDDDCVSKLGALAAEGIHDPAVMPFAHSWTDGTDDEVAYNVAARVWHARTMFAAEHWMLSFAVFDVMSPDEPMGMTTLFSEGFPSTRTVTTSSWLGKRFQGRGYGTEMRRAMLSLAFDGLGAVLATTRAFTHNTASLSVTRKCGYELIETAPRANRDGMVDSSLFHLTRARWEVTRPARPVTWSGLEPVRAALGIV